MGEGGYYGQRAYRVRLGWGPRGAETTAGDLNVIVDVLSFSTSVCIAVERGMTVYPFQWHAPDAERFARDHDAFLAGGQPTAGQDGAPVPKLSPSALLRCPVYPRIVLPSPNGSAISERLGQSGGEVLIGCLRNRRAVAGTVSARLRADPLLTVSVVAAGERWRADGSLRPCLEDALGAGAILASLMSEFRAGLSPEARHAAQAFAAARPDLGELLHDCVGGRELAARGLAEDVRLASSLDSSATVPTLAGGAFTRPPPARPGGRVTAASPACGRHPRG